MPAVTGCHAPACRSLATRPLPRLRLVDRPLFSSFFLLRTTVKTGSVLARYKRQFVDGVPGFFSGARPRAPIGAILGNASGPRITDQSVKSVRGFICDKFKNLYAGECMSVTHKWGKRSLKICSKVFEHSAGRGFPEVTPATQSDKKAQAGKDGDLCDIGVGGDSASRRRGPPKHLVLHGRREDPLPPSVDSKFLSPAHGCASNLTSTSCPGPPDMPPSFAAPLVWPPPPPGPALRPDAVSV